MISVVHKIITYYSRSARHASERAQNINIGKASFTWEFNFLVVMYNFVYDILGSKNSFRGFPLSTHAHIYTQSKINNLQWK